jgi:predicted ATPase
MNKKKHFDPRKASTRVSKIILRKHFVWCKKEGRDISWYQAENKLTSQQANKLTSEEFKSLVFIQ